MPVKYAFIVGMPRSGTTLLCELLGRHPSIIPTPETHLFRRYFRTPRAVGTILSGAEQSRLADRFERDDRLGQLDLAAIVDAARGEGVARTGAALLQEVLLAGSGARDGQLILEKTPDHVFFLPALKLAFPDSLIIHIYRDPRAVSASLKQVPWDNNPAVWHARQWRRAVSAASGAGAAVHHVAYEDLVRAPEDVLSDLFARLGVEPASTLNRQSAESSFDPHLEPWKARASAPPDPSRLDWWRLTLNRGDIAVIEAVCGGQMPRLGYQREHRLQTGDVAALGAQSAQLLGSVPRSVGKSLGWVAR
ncbi:MAG: sulfotransferase [Pseudomonadota bacterium]